MASVGKKQSGYRIAAPLLLLTCLAFPAYAEPFPEPLAQRLSQGLHACLKYYETDAWPMDTLRAQGFSTRKKTARIVVQLPSTKRKIYVETVMEGAKNVECEVHTNYTRSTLRRDGFDMIMNTSEAAGFVLQKRHSFSSDTKTVFVKGTNSMFMKVRVRDSKLMLKFKRRPMKASG